ncbi:hypothetical protein LZ31DRAFT_342688 [Colletotrichum somersetense]|nr:hypothetical protein LZ31DRAFT_342688 [Colletotrichum somersetense]
MTCPALALTSSPCHSHLPDPPADKIWAYRPSHLSEPGPHASLGAPRHPPGIIAVSTLSFPFYPGSSLPPPLHHHCRRPSPAHGCRHLQLSPRHHGITVLPDAKCNKG